MTLERAVEPVAAAPQAALPLAEPARPRLGNPAPPLAADPLDRQVMRVLALVGELHDREPGLDLAAREREVELAGLDEQPRRCRTRRGRRRRHETDREREQR